MKSRRFISATLLAGYVLAQAVAWIGHDAAAHGCLHTETSSDCHSDAGHQHGCDVAAGERLHAAAAHSSEQHDCAACQFHLQSQLAARGEVDFRHEEARTTNVAMLPAAPVAAVHSDHLSRGPPQLG